MKMKNDGEKFFRVALFSNKAIKRVKRKKQTRAYRQNRLKMLLQMRECKKILKKMEVKSDEMV